jgi:hypothetical protein
MDFVDGSRNDGPTPLREVNLILIPSPPPSPQHHAARRRDRGENTVAKSIGHEPCGATIRDEHRPVAAHPTIADSSSQKVGGSGTGVGGSAQLGGFTGVVTFWKVAFDS